MSLGKRKRRYQLISNDTSGSSGAVETTAELQARFQEYFEAKFKPLEPTTLPARVAQSSESRSEDSESGWDGLSDVDEKEGPEVIEHHKIYSTEAEIPKDELKTFMTAKPPPSVHSPMLSKEPIEPTDLDEAASDAANLKKDLALQRLLKESHLLDSQSTLSVVGRNRHRAVDMRLQDLGSKSSLYAQQKMPMSHRKGIAAKTAEQEAVRRKEAAENGIILEKFARVKKDRHVQRQRSVGAPTVGKFRGGMLKLSKKDVTDIEGPKKVMKKRR